MRDFKLRNKTSVVLIFLSLLLGWHIQTLAKGRGRILDREAMEYRLKGYKALQNKSYDEAIQYLQKACFLDPYYASPHNDLGLIYEAKGWGEKAEQEYLKAISIDPNFAEAVMNLGLFYESRGLVDKAVPYFQKRIELGPPESPWVKQAQTRLFKYVPNLHKEFTEKEEARNLMYQALEEKHKLKVLPGVKTSEDAQKRELSAKEPELIVDQRLENYLRLEKDLADPDLKNWLLGMSSQTVEFLYGEPTQKKVFSRHWYYGDREIEQPEWFNQWISKIEFGSPTARKVYQQEGRELFKEKLIYKIPPRYKKYALKPQIVLIFENDRLTGWEK